LRSGLALAGANEWLRTGQPRQPWDDGLLTAHDVTGLDLRGTQLVVLSACEAGLGAVRSGDGILGLRRAIHLAGARAQIMTLAKIPDLAAAVVMIRFYEILSDHEDCGDEALRKAQLYVRDLTVQELQKRFLSTEFADLIPAPVHASLAASDPFFQPFCDARNWAPFVYVGPPMRLKISIWK
jgi:CHAT domain-containing protein